MRNSLQFQRDLEVKEMEQRNNVALQQLAEMVDSVIGMGPIISQHLCEKGLSMPHAAASSRMTSHRSESEYSLRYGSSKGQIKSIFFFFNFYVKLLLQYHNSQLCRHTRHRIQKEKMKALKVLVLR